ncbi:MAG TPA: flagellar hook-associated protein FlgK [Deltaproteobacteria bacterium]|nr:flagellar hook-associated protein FlgK [Deltaproteobacteria bacterium]HOA44477.1 flagellar hook-associated protein FlgK [Deltaproteobacteria bacterium]HOG83649.1 flagellar hook-associated protein FlgK [Deltaproteobacteria bacterium]HOY73619.1 flagellar hook-associated protein FlgK [Deltaproteobacteria bacterium]HPH49819.1 flagellar hook-associated protein FlgK [Deltaproteobacteria bacterium]
MPGLGGALDIARWSMYSSQMAIEIFSHNVANANTEGYSRQSLRVEANYPITMGPGQIGTGVRAVEVVRNYNNFLNQQVSLKKSEYSYWNSQRTAMEEIESIFNESDGYGINALMGEFWNAWGDLSNNPDGIPERQALVNKTDNLLSMAHEIDYNLRAYQRHLDANIRGSVSDVNSLVSQIAELNKNISSVEIDGMINANDLRDRRDLLLEELSQYMDINYYEEEQSGQAMVYILGGTPLVLGANTYSLNTERNATTGQSNVLWQDSSGRTVDITRKLSGGKIAGWVRVRDNNIDTYLASMNTLMEELAWQVNALHSEGVGLRSVAQMTGTVQGLTGSEDLATDYSTDPPTRAFLFSDRYHAGGTFDIQVFDDTGGVAGTYTITTGGTTVNDLIAAIETGTAGQIDVSLPGGQFQLTAAQPGHTFAISPSAGGEPSNALAILGVNCFFSWSEQVGRPLDDLTETIRVNDAIEEEPSLISSGYLDENGMVAPGSNDVARAIFNLQDKVIDDMGGSGTSTTMDAYYSSLVAQVGVDVQNTVNNEKFNDTLLGQYISRKEGISGVNLDHEMAELLKYQHLYQAAAKLISIADEMMQALISIK